MSEKKIKNIFIEGAILPDRIASSIANHKSKTNIGAHSIFLGQVRADKINDKEIKSIEYSAHQKMANKIYSLPQTNGINFAVKYIEVEGHKHRVSLAGNKKGTPVILMMGVFEDSLADARWLVSNMVNNDKECKFYFINLLT